ncbi:MAG: cytidine deaminase [Bacteroidales bacterium]
MQEIKTDAKIIFCSYSELGEEEKKLISSAKDAALSAYAPYSRFKVGAAVLIGSGDIITGNNQENTAYPSGMCAERVALFYARSAHPESPISILALAAYSGGKYKEEPITPCGACRQVLAEYEKSQCSDIKIIMYGENKIYIASSAKSLLPLAFTLE